MGTSASTTSHPGPGTDPAARRGAGRGRARRPGRMLQGALRGGRGTTAGERRRAVEAELIGLDDTDLSWWAPCWERGKDGTMPAGRLFDALRALHPEVRVLHDLRVAGTGTQIDHVLVGPGGVVVVDTEACPGRVRTDGVHLRVKGRDRSPMIDVALWQAEVVRSTLARRGIRDVPVHGVLHWQHVEGLGSRPICLRGVPLLSGGATMGLAAAGIAVSPFMVERIAAALGPAGVRH